MKIKDRPTDEQILAAVAKYGRHGAMTYVVRNVLQMENRRFGDLRTSHVLYRLKRFEKAGKVERVRSSYVTQYCWKVVS